MDVDKIVFCSCLKKAIIAQVDKLEAKVNYTIYVIQCCLLIGVTQYYYYFTSNVFIYQLKMPMFYNGQTTNLTFVDKSSYAKMVIALRNFT